MKRYFLGFKIYYLVYLLLAFNAFINESLWMEYATDLLAVLGVGCALCMLKTAKPSFANHAMFTREWGENYAIASCYNGLKIGGGGFTLPRIRLYECSLKAKDPQDFLDNVLPRYVQIMLEMMEIRS